MGASKPKEDKLLTTTEKLPMGPYQDEPPLFAIKELFTYLNKEEIRYCHWKSNCRLYKSLRGLTDMDLLVDPSHGPRFKQILEQFKIKPVQSPRSIQYPGIEDYLGCDTETGRLFHIHLHYQLILGEQFVKNYHLPLEEDFLDYVQLYDRLVKIPLPELEISVLAIRAMLKYRDRDAIKDILSIRSQGMPPEFIDEVNYLLCQTDWGRISNTLTTHFGFITPGIVLEMLKTVISSPRRGFLFYRLRNQLRGEIRVYQRYSHWRAGCIYWAGSLQQLLPFIDQDRYKKIPTTGGRIIAVVGADGSGKSTVIAQLGKWLSWKLKTKHYYMGSQQPSITTNLLELGFRFIRKLSRIVSKAIGEKNVLSRFLAAFQHFCRNVYHLSVSQDRYRRYIACCRQAARGTLVLCDRYPLEAIWKVIKGRPMDGPLIAFESGVEMGRLTRWLSEQEQNIYRKIHPPDYILVLHVSPEVSHQRKPDHDMEMIMTKSLALNQMARLGLSVVDIDADRPIEQVLLQIKRAVWERL